jgi:hypothetical protein
MAVSLKNVFYTHAESSGMTKFPEARDELWAFMCSVLNEAGVVCDSIEELGDGRTYSKELLEYFQVIDTNVSE